MNNHPSTHTGIKLFRLLCSVSLLILTFGWITHIQASTAIDQNVYLPIVIKPAIGLSGAVTLNGAPASDVALDLRFYNGSSWSTLASTTTAADGSYLFSSVPALATGQRYAVLYHNDTDPPDPSRLNFWVTAVNTTYDATSLVVFATFDIANIELSTPDPEATVELPAAFSWIPRPSTPTDLYQFQLFDPAKSDPYFQSDPLGYVGSYNLAKLPTGFTNGVEYGWGIGVYSPDGGYGHSYYYHPIQFK